MLASAVSCEVCVWRGGGGREVSFFFFFLPRGFNLQREREHGRNQ
jgi:hypothetical protein